MQVTFEDIQTLVGDIVLQQLNTTGFYDNSSQNLTHAVDVYFSQINYEAILQTPNLNASISHNY